jgi:hypothetical protein
MYVCMYVYVYMYIYVYMNVCIYNIYIMFTTETVPNLLQIAVRSPTALTVLSKITSLR